MKQTKLKSLAGIIFAGFLLSGPLSAQESSPATAVQSYCNSWSVGQLSDNSQAAQDAIERLKLIHGEDNELIREVLYLQATSICYISAVVVMGEYYGRIDLTAFDKALKALDGRWQ